MNRTAIINHLIERNNYKSFLEIGVNTGINSHYVKAEVKVGVDPEPLPSGMMYTTHKMTSDDFFKQNKETFDIVFVDGLHHAEQVYKDIINSLECLNKGGTIVCHDMNPLVEIHQRVPRETKIWNGDCWKAWVLLREKFDNLTMRVVDTDWGCGVIQEGEQETIKLPTKLKYKDLDNNRKEWLNLIDVETFKKLY